MHIFFLLLFTHPHVVQHVVQQPCLVPTSKMDHFKTTHYEAWEERGFIHCACKDKKGEIFSWKKRIIVIFFYTVPQVPFMHFEYSQIQLKLRKKSEYQLKVHLYSLVSKLCCKRHSSVKPVLKTTIYLLFLL